MFDATIDLASLCVLVVVVVCSWGVAILCSLTCWNSYKKSRPNHLYCTQCSTLAGPPLPVTIPVTIPPLQYQYAPAPSQPQYNSYRAHSHTAERLGILEPDNLRACRDSNLNYSSHESYPAFPRAACGVGMEVLETVHVPSPASAGEEALDQNTTISRSFRSARKRRSNEGRSQYRGVLNDSKSCLTLNERFGTLPSQLLDSEDGNKTVGSTVSAQSKMSQVRIISSPPPYEDGDGNHALTRTPSNAMKLSKKSIFSKSISGYKSMKTRRASRISSRETAGEGTSKLPFHVNTKDTKEYVGTSEAAMVTSDEDVFIKNIQRTGQQLGQYHDTPVNPEIVVTRQFSQEQLQLHRPRLVTPSSGGSDWTNPKKERQVGSPGNTANADFFIRQHTPQVMNIDLEKPGVDRILPKTDIVSRHNINKPARRGVLNSAPPRSTRQGSGDHQGQQHGVENHNLLGVKSRRAYKPGYSESDVTSQSEDEVRRQNWQRRGALEPELPPLSLGPSPDIRFDLTPPVLDLSQVVPSTSSNVPHSAPLYTTSALSTDPSPLQYSSVSFLQSDMSLILSPTTPVNYASSQSSHPVSLDWDNYASDPQFQHHKE